MIKLAVGCSVAARFMALSADDKAAQLVGRVLEARLLTWPIARPSPSALADQTFLVGHAHLIKVCVAQLPSFPAVGCCLYKTAGPTYC